MEKRPDLIPWSRLLTAAYSRARKEIPSVPHISIQYEKNCWVHLKNTIEFDSTPPQAGFLIYEINSKYLFKLLTGVYHWNNAQVGSHYKVERLPDLYDRSVFQFLNHFVAV